MCKKKNCSIQWDDKFFEESGLCIWIYNNGGVEFTNEKFYKPALVKLYKHKIWKKQIENFKIYDYETK